MFFNEKTPLCLAVDKQLIDIVKLLLSNANIQVNTPFTYELYSLFEKEYFNSDNCTEKPRMEELNYFTKTALHIASINGNVEIVKLLLTNQSLDINVLSITKISKIDNYHEWGHGEFSDEDRIKSLIFELHLI